MTNISERNLLAGCRRRRNAFSGRGRKAAAWHGYFSGAVYDADKDLRGKRLQLYVEGRRAYLSSKSRSYYDLRPKSRCFDIPISKVSS